MSLYPKVYKKHYTNADFLRRVEERKPIIKKMIIKDTTKRVSKPKGKNVNMFKESIKCKKLIEYMGR